MKNALKLFITDLKRVAKTPGVWIILIGLAILPSFYAWFNLWAMWDPYGNTGHIKVAVVNEDSGDKIRGKKINVGDSMVKSLKKNDSFDWQFVSREKADHEIKMGKYYAGIYIPSKFTHEITGTLRKHPQKADVNFKVNQKINAVAAKLTDTGSSLVVEKANEQFNKTVTQALLSEANKVGLTLEDNVPTINKIKNAVYQANNALPKINEFADKVIYLNNHQDELDNYANKFRDLGKYKDNITDAQDKLNAVNAAVPALNERAKLILALNDYMPNIERLLNVAANDVPNQFPKINKGVNIASQGIDVANDQLTDAQGYLTQAKQRVKDYQDAAGRAQDVNGAVNNDLRNQQSTAQQSANQTHKDAGRSYSNMHTSQVSTNGDASPKGDTVLSDNDVKSMNTALTESLLSLSNQTDKQAQATQQDIKALKNISYGIIASDKPTQFKEPLDNVKSRLENATKYNQQMIDILSELEKSEHVDLSKEIKQIKQANNQINDSLRKTNQLIDALSNGSSGQSEAVKVLRSLPKLNSNLDAFRSYIKKELNQKLLSVSNEITDQLNKGQNTLSTIQSKLNTINQVINAGQDILSKGKERIDTIQSALPGIEQTYINAMRTAQDYFPTVKKDVAQAADFVRNDLPQLEQELANVTQSVNQNLPALFNRYDNAVNLLNENQPRAKEGLASLANFAENKLPDVEKDLKKADKVFKKLDKDDAVDKLIDTLKNDLKKQADTIANPINKKTTDVFPVKDYGSGMTPFYTALSIWVGGLLMVSLLSVDNKHEHLRPILTKRQIYLGKAGFFFMLGVIQALIVSIGDLVILKAAVESPVLFVSIAVFSSLVFNSIIYTCVSMLGNPGKAVAIILLVLQIAGGGGTFPIQTAPQFFQTISPYLPFTYAIDALRETVGGIVPEILITKVVVLTLFGLGFIIFGVCMKPVMDPLMRKIAKRAAESKVTE
ncbi:YhgE/Pip domain protein [Staphylococcus caprae M23864:W1]|uniref:Phage infection protein n=4 Tax=Bacilli TaxID=91061 RepID=A0ABM7FRL5_9STAP|nr:MULTISPECIES: YhgE/Pip domain-containing protein [Staphylococcus]EES41499.1 YhgE/Pip domain protein [Staphylococcus caprae M23864:W1]MBN6826484.1 YhgE/Pip domain-containing protein [Staphylococcus caprae]MBX5317775.1 YhgE/Pip domain-containing protein [Staphylococcus caprae]MBX5323319.1 YhgE/Pip domain-containing protein [Staphylococcus caprae]MCR6089760.1 YhgE/Pip domain-containing protein [Staphylococcus aureus]